MVPVIFPFELGLAQNKYKPFLAPNSHHAGSMRAVTLPLTIGHLFAVWLLASICNWPIVLFEQSKCKYMTILHNTVAIYSSYHM